MITDVAQSGGTLLVLSGNPNQHEEIWDVPGVITVGELSENLNYVGNNGTVQHIDLCAPSNFVYKLYENNSCAQIQNAGPSISAPHVAGTAALMLDLVPCLRPAETETIIKATAGPIANADEPSDPYYDIAGEGYLRIYEAVRYTNGDIDPIEEDELWDTPRYINGDVEILSGATLTVTSTIRFASDAQMIVRKGGELIVDGGTLTNGCDERWKGIVIEGDPSTFQSVSPYTGIRGQGYVKLKDATLENAEFGVRIYDPEATNPHNTTGGVLVAINTDFINNFFAVDFAPYQNFSPFNAASLTGNLSYFSECRFVVNDDFPGNYQNFGAHVSLYRVTGIEFYGCDFSNEIDHMAYTYADDAKAAITSRDAHFIVTRKCSGFPFCSTEKRSTFDGFATAISAYDLSTVNTFAVSYTDFTNNYTGINMNKIDKAYIVRNNFIVGMDLPGLYNPYKGINMFRCEGFKVEENDFQPSITALPGKEKLGIVTIGSGSEFNEIYNNDFHNMDYANVANGDNRGPVATKGLVYSCNSNEENQYDFAIPDEGVSSWGIAQNQGALNEAADNDFTPFPLNPFSHYLNDASSIVYFHSSGKAPTHYTTATVALNSQATVNQCASKLPNDGQISVLSEVEKTAFKQLFFSSYDDREKTYAANMLLRDILLSDSIPGLDSTRTWLENKGDLYSQFLIVDSYLQQGDFSNAESTLDAIPVKYSLSGDDLNEYNQFAVLKTIQIDALEISKGEDQMILDNLAAIQQIAESGEYVAAVQAQNMVNAVSGPIYERIIVLPDNSQSLIQQKKKIRPEDIRSNQNPSAGTLSVSPNPIKTNNLTVTYMLPDDSDSASLVLSSLEGKVIRETELLRPSDKLLINTGDLANGMYFYTLSANGSRLRSLKFIIAR